MSEPSHQIAAAWDRGRWAGAYDALQIVRRLNGDGFHEPADAALDAAEDAIRQMILHRHGPDAIVAPPRGPIAATTEPRWPPTVLP